MSEFNNKEAEQEKENLNDDVQGSAETASASKTSSFLKNLIEQVELIVIVFAVIILIFSFFFRTCQVEGSSMENTLQDKETVVVTDLFFTPKRNDIIVFHQTGTLNEPVVKRVIGLPGDKVEIVQTSDLSMIVKVNGETLTEEYIKLEGGRDYPSEQSFTVDDGTVFVMGDNRNNSKDSRSSDIGLVDQRRILGKVIFRVTPISRIGTVK